MLLFFFNHPATTEIYTLSLHDALPISVFRASGLGSPLARQGQGCSVESGSPCGARRAGFYRSEEHTSELQSHSDLVCRLLLDKKNVRIVLAGAQGIRRASSGIDATFQC